MDGFRIAFGQSIPEVWSMPDAEFLNSISWSRTAPERAVDAAQEGDANGVFHALCKVGFGLVSSKGRKKASNRHPHKRTLWSRLAFDASTNTENLLEFWEKYGQKKGRSGAKRKQHRAKSKKRQQSAHDELSTFDRWIERANRRKKVTSLELLVLMELLQQTGADLPAEIGWRAWRLALAAALTLGETADPAADAGLTGDQRLLVYGELPVAAGAFFNCVKKSKKVFRAGATFLSEQLEANTDTDGTPNARLLPRISIWLAPLVRATEWAGEAGESLWDKPSEERFGLLLERAAAICRPAGQLALSNGRSCGVAGLLADASRLAGWKKKSPASRYVLAVGNENQKLGRAGARRRFLAEDERPATQSDWARLACLRNNWSATPDTLVVAHHCDKPQLDLTALGRPLVSGAWDLEIVVDGKSVALKDDWECTCWFSDDEADFMELHVSLEGDITVERQLLLAREEHFAILADVVTAPEGCRVEYSSRLPLVSGVEVETDTVTRECTLKCRNVRARAFPLSLPDERILGAPGGFAPRKDCLELQQQADGGLFAPVLIDWDPARRHDPADWRTLTVTEEGRVLKRSAASANRLRIGDHQVVVYRSLRASGEMRAVIGHHTPHETVIGRFDDEGVVDPILIVES